MKRNSIFDNEKKMFSQKKGVALIAVYFTLMVLTILFISFMSRTFTESRAALRNKDVAETTNLAEAGIDQVTGDLQKLFKTYFAAMGNREVAFGWFDDLPNSAKYTLPVNQALGTGIYTVDLTNVDVSIPGQRDITLVSTAQINGITKKVTAVVRYSLVPSDVFKNSYFVNNLGWMWGGGITLQGDMRANGNISLQGSPTVNGDVYAAVNDEIGAAGTITGTNASDNINYYRSHSPDTARPSNPSANPQDINSDGIVEQFPYEGGYDGNSQHISNLEGEDMPYLGDLQQYKDIAISQNGTIKQDGVVLVNHVLDTTGHDMIVLTGTTAHPIVLDGPVVIAGDVLIKGVVTGQGTIYAGRNIHIGGNLTYKNPPQWTKPDTHTATTDAHNDAADFLGLAAKGNIVVGDYTTGTFNQVKPYLKPPFTQPYKVDPSDAGIGYVSYTSGGDSYFNADYTTTDGGRKVDSLGNDAGARSYYESSLKNSEFRSFCDAGYVNRVDAICYTNHTLAGRWSNMEINGTFVSRDDATYGDGSSFIINYDIRAQSNRLGLKMYLPRSLAVPITLYVKRN
jgi:cytoskeletal protein CcmA (bactofilin family)